MLVALVAAQVAGRVERRAALRALERCKASARASNQQPMHARRSPVCVRRWFCRSSATPLDATETGTHIECRGAVERGAALLADVPLLALRRHGAAIWLPAPDDARRTRGVLHERLVPAARVKRHDREHGPGRGGRHVVRSARRRDMRRRWDGAVRGAGRGVRDARGRGSHLRRAERKALRTAR